MKFELSMVCIAVFINSMCATDLNDLGSLAKIFAMLAGESDCEFKCPASK